MGVMGAIAVCLASALPLAKAAEEGPESLITAPIKALEENNPKLIWDMLPASYQKDLNELVQTFANEMDAELWDAGAALIGDTGKFFIENKDLFAEWAIMVSGEDIQISEMTPGFEMLGKFCEKLVISDFGRLDKLKKVDLGNVANTLGREMMTLMEDVGKATGETDPFGLELLRGIKVEVVSEDGDNATIKVSGLPEIPDLGNLLELPDGLPPGLPGLPDTGEIPFANFSEFENGELEVVKVEGKWIPKEAAEAWKEVVKIAKEELQGGFDIPAEDKQQALTVINITRAFYNNKNIKKAETAEQFQIALSQGMEQAVMQVMMGGSSLGNAVSPAQKAEARQLAKGEISLTNGDIIEGTVADVDQNGIVVRRDIGGFAQRANWMQLTQQSLKKIRRLGQTDPKRYRGAAAYAEPFIEPDESKMEKNLSPGPVKGLIPPQLPSSVEVASKVAAFGSGGGVGLLVAIALGSMMAGLGVAAFRESNVLLVAGVSLFLPIIGPILFLVKPKVEYEDEYDEDEEYEYEEVETPGGATMTDTGGGGVAGMMPEAKKMSFAQTGSKKSGLKPQSWTRGDTRFDRSFFQNNFPNYFKTVIGATEREFVLALKTGKREYVGQRIKRISGTDIHMELLNGKEQKISFSEMGTVELRPK